MTPAATPVTARSSRRFAPWAVGPWLLLLLGAFGGVQYLHHREYLYLAGDIVVIVVCAGCILRQAWARPALRVLAVLLSLGALLSGAMMLRQWGDFDVARQHALTQSQLGQVLVFVINRWQRAWEISLVLRALAIPLLLWLAWGLGRPGVRAQFRARP